MELKTLKIRIKRPPNPFWLIPIQDSANTQVSSETVDADQEVKSKKQKE